MDKFSWQGFLFAPIRLTERQKSRIIASSNWSPWESRFNTDSTENLDDHRRFLLSPVSEKIFPLCESEKCLRQTLDLSAIGEGIPTFLGKTGDLASIVWIDLLILDTFSLLIIKLATEKDIDASELYTLNRKVPCWFERNPHDNVAHWRTNSSDKVTLRAWVEKELLGFSDDESKNAFGDTDWFGHSLPMASFVGKIDSAEVTTDDHFINLMVGAPFEDESYALCSTEHRRLIDEQTMQVYKNWVVGDFNSRILFYGVGDSKTPLSTNIEKHYIYIVAVVFYQKIMLTYLLEGFLKSSCEKEKVQAKDLRKNILTFRREYVFNKISTYPMGEKIYQFLFKNDDVQSLLERLTAEIESNDDYERIVLERRENAFLNSIAIFAAITLPVTTIGTVYGIKDKYIFNFSSFWLWSGVATLVFLVILLGLIQFFKKGN